MANNFDHETLVTLRAVLEEAAQELNPSQATQAKMAQTIMRRAAEGDVSREELKTTAIAAGRAPAA
jgi:hypothetical protein